jgi:hypothetical protein
VQSFATSAIGGTAEVENVRLFQIATDLVGGNSQNTGVPHPQAMPIDPIPRTRETVGVELKPGRPCGQLHHQIIGLPAGTPTTNFLLKVLGIAGPTPSGTDEVEGLKSLWGGLFWETLHSGWSRGVSSSRPFAYPTTAAIEDLEEPTEANEDANKED